VLRISEKRLPAMGADLLDVGITGSDMLHIVMLHIVVWGFG
jgi:hypothetical protein